MYGKIRLSLLAGLFTVFPALAADDHCGTAAYPLERLQLDRVRQDAGWWRRAAWCCTCGS